MIERFCAMHDFPSCDITAEVRKPPNKRIVLGLTAYYGGVIDKQQFGVIPLAHFRKCGCVTKKSVIK